MGECELGSADSGPALLEPGRGAMIANVALLAAAAAAMRTVRLGEAAGIVRATSGCRGGEANGSPAPASSLGLASGPVEATWLDRGSGHFWQ